MNTIIVRRRRARALRAYTLVEVLMALAVLAIGVAGVIAMQGVTAAANRHAKNLAAATHIAQSWLDMLATESSLWTESGSLTRTTWLAQGANLNGWFRPQYNAALNFGAAFDALGNPVPTLDEARDAQYCVDLRFTTLSDGAFGAGLLRAEVRVYWRRDDAVPIDTTPAPAHACALTPVQVSTAGADSYFHFVHFSGAVRQQARGEPT